MKPIGLKNKDNVTYLNNYSLKQLAKNYQTPLYVLDETTLIKNINDYLDNFKSTMFETTVVYASKALLVKGISEIINSYNMHIDAVSLGDLYVLKESGFNMNHVVFHGNNKSIEELMYAVKNNVGIIVIDNLFELKHLINILNNLKISIKVMFRVNPGIDVHTHEYVQTSKIASKFGESIFDEDIIDNLIRTTKRCDYLDLIGFHAHIGSSIMDSEVYLLEIEKMVAFQNMINNKYHLALSHLNIGGGFGITYTKKNKAIPIKEMMNNIVGYLEAEISKTNSLIKHIYIEPGRSIVGTAGITLYTISQIKPTYGKKNYLFIDGGMTDNIRPALYQAIYEVDVVDKMHLEKDILVDVVGKCCESGDIIRKDVFVPNVIENDILVVYGTGAYNYSMFSNYNNMLKPTMILVGKNVKILSKREELNDLMRLF